MFYVKKIKNKNKKMIQMNLFIKTVTDTDIQNKHGFERGC